MTHPTTDRDRMIGEGAKACPFCGTRRVEVINRGSWFDTMCAGCGARGPSANTAGLAIERWNWRRKAKRS